MRKVLIVDASGPAAVKLRDTALASDICPYIIIHRDYEHVLTRDAHGWAGRYALTDLSRPAVAHHDICAYAKHGSVDGVLTVDEFLVSTVAGVVNELGLPGVTASPIEAGHNKAVMNKLFVQSRVPAPRTYTARSPADAAWFAAENSWPYPLVVKPVDSAGSTAVAVARNAAELQRAATDVQALKKKFPYEVELDPRILIQEFVQGQEFSVESVIHRGNVTHVAIVRKRTSTGRHRVELGHSTPPCIASEEQSVLMASTSAAIDAIGMTDGMTHTEIMLTADGTAVVLEIACRMGGMPLPDLVNAATGVDLWRAALDVATGVLPSVQPTRRYHAEASFLTSPATGTVTGVVGSECIPLCADDFTLRMKLGDNVRAPTSNRDRLGHVLVSGPDRRSVIESLTQLDSRLYAVIQPDDAALGPERVSLLGDRDA